MHDKTGIIDLARALCDLGFELVSTDGTYKHLTRQGNLQVQQVSDLTGFSEIMDGRVKTLHPAIHGGILARRDLPSHMSQLAAHRMQTIDVVVVNLYPFVQTVSKPNVTLDEALENIDIGGPTMVRAAAKNFKFVIVLVDPNDYPWVLQRLKGSGLSLQERQKLAQKAFQHVALYDTAIASYLDAEGQLFPEELTLGYRKLYDLRYGENPHQKAAFYSEVVARGGMAGARQLHGKELSLNNIVDADAAWQAVSEFVEPSVAIVKHANPCGLAVHEDQVEAYKLAYKGDTVSAFGGIVAFNKPVETASVEAMKKVFYEVVVAPGYEPEALEILKKKKDLRILEVPSQAGSPGKALDIKNVSGGLLLQTQDILEEDPTTWKVATVRRPSDKDMEDLVFAWKAVKHIKSNAIVLAKNRAIVGMGAGQPNRVTSVHLALKVAGPDRAKGSVLASDAFFPFSDSIETAAQGGVTAIAQPGGSIRDQESVDAANRFNIAMVFTGVRHFRH